MTPSQSAASVRASQVRRGLDTVRERIDVACAQAGRSPVEVTLIVVTKTYPATDVALLHALGVCDIGENRDQEAAAKRDEARRLIGETIVPPGAGMDRTAGGPLRWHLIGRLQTNKCRSVASWAETVHSLDRPRVVDALDRAADEAGRRIGALVQVSLDGDPQRGGALVDQVGALADRIADTRSLDLRGVMAVAPLGADPRASFERLAEVSAGVRRAHPAAGWMSAGMSQDLESAIAAGATHVRVGSAVLGARAPLG